MEPLSANDPATVGEFALRARLGAGGMGRVYLASSPAGRAVAIKVVHPELASDPEFRQRFSREVAAARAVSGMYTAPVVASGLDDNPPWLATAFVPGPSLATVIARYGPLPETAVWRLAAGLAEALRAVHACGLIHRDLKPANVLLAADGPHVIDFGISRAFEGTALTSAGMVIGTPGYMSPEQAEGAVAGPESDVFSLGCVLAYAATGNPPFGSGNAASVLYRVVTAEPDLTGVPARLRQVIESCLTKNPAERTGLSQLSSLISTLGPAGPAAFGSFWPDPVAGIIAADQAYPETSPAQAGQGPAPATLNAAAGGYQPTAVAQGTPGTPGALGALGSTPAAAPGAAGFGGMVPDGYLAAATSGTGNGQRGIGYPQAPSSPPQQPATPWPSNTWPATPWPQQPGAQQPGTPVPLEQYAPARRRPTMAETPPAVLAAIRLMYAGAIASLTGAIVGAVTEFRFDRFAAEHPLTLAGIRAHTAAGYIGFTTVIGGSVGVLCWILVAMACRRGRGWVRSAASALLGLQMAGLLLDLFATHGDAWVKVISLLVWAIGLTAVVLLWSQQARRFFFAWRDR